MSSRIMLKGFVVRGDGLPCLISPFSKHMVTRPLSALSLQVAKGLEDTAPSTITVSPSTVMEFISIIFRFAAKRSACQLGNALPAGIHGLVEIHSGVIGIEFQTALQVFFADGIFGPARGRHFCRVPGFQFRLHFDRQFEAGPRRYCDPHPDPPASRTAPDPDIEVLSAHQPVQIHPGAAAGPAGDLPGGFPPDYAVVGSE